jgi:HAD superfamily hydrolase (TIGR01549 family)
MTFNQPFSAIIFDLDDTLVPSKSAYTEAMQSIGIPESDPVYLEARKQIKAQLPLGAPIARSRMLYFKKYLELTGEYSSAKHLQISELYEQAVINYQKQAWDRLQRNDLISTILSKNLAIGILTNETVRFQIQKLNAFWPKTAPLSSFVVSEEIGFEKPHPKMFETTRQRLSRKLGSDLVWDQILYVGDSLEMDIQPCVDLKIPVLHTVEFAYSETDQKAIQQIHFQTEIPAQFSQDKSIKSPKTNDQNAVPQIHSLNEVLNFI